MKVSLNMARRLGEKYKSSDDITAIGVDKLVEKVGAQLGGVDEVINLGQKYQGIIIAKVVSCVKHPAADKLSLCKIDDGGVAKDVERDGQGHVQVVCGAPNVREGLTVAWLPPGTTVPETFDKDPFVLEAREIRGQKSNGMLASPKELALGEGHDGILEIADEAPAGADFAETLGLDDTILDIENKMFTHRPDCFGFLGIARELAGIQGMSYKSPDWYNPAPDFPAIEGQELTLAIRNEVPELAPRFCAVIMSDVKVGPSPLWLQTALAELGQKSINNIVDYTNFYMLETGQPLHAYDYDKVKALSDGEVSLVVRNPKPGERVKLLNDKEIEPRPEAVMIATDKQLIGIGGVMGGSETEVDNNTTNIILECANFDMYSVRRTSMAHGLFTEAVTRFTKGQSPLQNLAVLAKIVDEIRAHAEGKVASSVVDDNHVDSAVLERGSLHPPVKLSAEFINARLGLKLSVEEIKKLLENVEFQVETATDAMTVKAPFWRTDIELREDVVEEVGRLYGYDKLPLELPARDLTPAAEDALFNLKAAIRGRLSKAGANEVLTYSFVHGDLFDKTGQDQAKAFQVSNALSPDLQYFRISLMPSLLDKVHMNIKAGYDQFALFELGKTHDLDHITDEGLPDEFEFTALIVTANEKTRPVGAPYYQARQYLEALASPGQLEFKPVAESMRHYPVVQPYDLNRTAMVSFRNGDFLGIIGEFKPSVTRVLKLPKYAAGFEVDTTALQSVINAGPAYSPLSRFPSVKQDITLKVSSDIPYQELYEFLTQELDNQTDDIQAQFEPLDIYQKPDDIAHKQLTFRLTVTSADRTLTDTEVNKLLTETAETAKNKFDAERI